MSINQTMTNQSPTETYLLRRTSWVKKTAIIIFKEKTIRRTWHDDAWWFSVIDVCAVLTDTLFNSLGC